MASRESVKEKIERYKRDNCFTGKTAIILTASPNSGTLASLPVFKINKDLSNLRKAIQEARKEGTTEEGIELDHISYTEILKIDDDIYLMLEVNWPYNDTGILLLIPYAPPHKLLCDIVIQTACFAITDQEKMDMENPVVINDVPVDFKIQ